MEAFVRRFIRASLVWLGVGVPIGISMAFFPAEAIVHPLTADETIRRWPGTMEVFGRFGIDACCGGAVPVDEAAVA